MTTSFDTQHEDMIHDAQLDFYGKHLATCSSDRTIKIFDSAHRLLQVLSGHDGPVWQVSWAHPKFGNVLASCSYDSCVFIWKQVDGVWSKVFEHRVHLASVNSIGWAPHEFGAILACGSSDGKVSILTYANGSWENVMLDAHAIGCNTVAWAPALLPGEEQTFEKRFASGGCDNVIKIWREGVNGWEELQTLSGHSDWVRDVAWAPAVGLPKSYMASCSQDRTVMIWTQENAEAEWNCKLLTEKFPDVVWRVCWSLSGACLAVSCGDNKVTLWKENMQGEWECVGEEQ